jgi:pimeloyl-ACP methyl ester carboxylesterase
MHAQGWTDAHVVGHSLGGLVALFLAHAAPARVRSLALLCTFASGAVPTRLTPWLIGAGLRTRLGTRRSRRDAFLEMILSPSEFARSDRDALALRLGELFGRPLERQPRIVMDQLRAMRRADATPFLRALGDIPTLVLSAEHDRIAPPAAGRALAAGIPGARFIEIEGSAHACTILEAGRVNALLIEHLAAAETRRSISAR